MDKSSHNLKTRVIIEKIEKARNMFPIELRHHSLTINRVIMNKTQTLIATCSNDNLVYIYNSITYECINKFECKAAVKDIVFESKTDRIIAATALGEIAIFDVYKFQSEQDNLLWANRDQRFFTMSLSYGDQYLGIIWNHMFKDPDAGDCINKLIIYKLSDLTAAMENHKNDRQPQYSVGHYKKIAGDDSEPFTRVAFYLKDSQFFLSSDPGYIHKYDLEVNEFEPVAKQEVMRRGVNSLTFSPHYEFLIVSGNEGVKLLDPDTLDIFRTIYTKYPVLCAQMSHLMYEEKPRFHLIFAGGIPAREQATRAEGGNEINVYNIAREEKLFELGGTYGNVNWITLFKDGSGFVTAGEEAIARIYRFDQSYFEDPIFQ
jgi:translation initiation factor 3 subunit I